MTPSEAGFDGTVLMPYRGVRSPLTIRFRRGPIDNPHRLDFGVCQFVCLNREDGSVEKLLYRNADGKVFELQFVEQSDA